MFYDLRHIYNVDIINLHSKSLTIYKLECNLCFLLDNLYLPPKQSLKVMYFRRKRTSLLTYSSRPQSVETSTVTNLFITLKYVESNKISQFLWIWKNYRFYFPPDDTVAAEPSGNQTILISYLK